MLGYNKYMSFSIKQVQQFLEKLFLMFKEESQLIISRVDHFIISTPLKAFIIFVCGIIGLRIITLGYRKYRLRELDELDRARSSLYRFIDFNSYYIIIFLCLDIFNGYLEKFNRADYLLAMHIFGNFLLVYILYINIGYLHSFLNLNFRVYFKRSNKDFVKDSKKLRYIITLTTLIYIVLYNLFSTFLGHNIISIIFFIIYTKILLDYEKYADIILAKIIPSSISIGVKHIPKFVIHYVLPPVFYIYTLLYSLYLVILLANNTRDWSRNILSGLLEQHLENFRQDSFNEIDIPEDYKACFENEEDVQIVRKPDPAAMAYDRIDEWLNGVNPSYHLAFSGGAGSGKNHILNKILKRYSSVNSFKINIHEKITEGSILHKRLEQFVGNGDEDEKKFVIVNSAHNLFLSKLNGFKAFDALFNIINSSSKNVFWLTIWNANSLNLIKHIYNKYELSADSVFIRPWDKEELKNLIIKRHEKSELEIRFQPELFEVMCHFGADRSIENALDIYFRILGKQTGGNPQAAINTWLKSILSIDDKSIELHLPSKKPIHEIESLTDESLFVLSTILSHERLNIDQISATTDLSEKVVNFVLKNGLNKGIIDKDKEDNSYLIRKDWLYDLKKILKKRNFIYE
ncbi:hypothetical protein BALOs_1267 [Halobacteriovorax sp. BALOs_7]|nr:hypothetical protein BALOs_1267 [Halobacteriovorax sp. BALOs_7]